jgi:hypothetical protein
VLYDYLIINSFHGFLDLAEAACNYTVIEMEEKCNNKSCNDVCEKVRQRMVCPSCVHIDTACIHDACDCGTCSNN